MRGRLEDSLLIPYPLTDHRASEAGGKLIVGDRWDTNDTMVGEVQFK